VRILLVLAILALASGAAGSQPAENTVTLDVKDADVRDVLQSLKQQCGIKNMIIDKEVPAATATFYFREVPCETAFRAVFRTFNLAYEPQPNSVLRVSPLPR